MRRFVKLLLVLALPVLGCAYGILLHRNRLFPYYQLRAAYARLFPASASDSKFIWSIGIRQGATPFELSDVPGVKNPVLTAKDVTDRDAMMVADPFLIQRDGTYYMFFEVQNMGTENGDIGLAESPDGLHWTYKQIVIDEPYHLSFPYVFAWEGEYYMIPESSGDLAVCLYKATNFPTEWKLDAILLRGYTFVDVGIIRHEDLWWLFVGSATNDALNLYYADALQGPWVHHPQSPIVKFDPHAARLGGRLLEHDGRLYRFAQDDEPEYGTQVWAYEITEMTPTAYAERRVGNTPIVTKNGRGWNAQGMHQVDPLQLADGTWLAAVDGQVRRRLP